jgi:hypothetical protein
MSIDITEAILQVRQFLNEPLPVFWSDEELLDWIKEGCTDFSSKSLMVETNMTVTLIENQIKYTVTGVLEPYACLYNDGYNNWKGVMKVHPRVIGNESVNTAGDTRYYSLFHNSLYVWPPPSQTVVAAGAYLDLFCSVRTNDIADIHDEYQHIPLLYAKAQAKYKDQKFAEANTLMTVYMSAASFERQDKHAREEDSLDMFKIKAKGGQQGAT